MIDVAKNRLEAKATKEGVERANEENEWAARLKELSKNKPKKEKKSRAPSRMNKVRRVSSRQQIAVGR